MARLPKLQVFVSSTSEDLKPYRVVAGHEIRRLEWEAVQMEDWLTDTGTTVKALRNKIEDCDLMLLIVAHRKGWVPTDEQGGDGVKSITALEHDFARAHDIPVRIVMADEYWPFKLTEKDEKARAWMEDFRNNVNQFAAFFHYENPTVDETKRLPDFRTLIRGELLKDKEELAKQASAKATAEDTGETIELYFEPAQEVTEGAGIPFVGPGVYNDGPLSTLALIDALRAQAIQEPTSLATVAEFREKQGKRANLIKKLRGALSKQSQAVEGPLIYDVLANSTANLIVSTTYDQVLEKKLVDADQAFVVLSHIIHSNEKKNDGKILIVHADPKRKPEACFANEFVIEEDTLVIYKPLGSPFLHDKPDPELEIDTVVITENDQFTLLRRLETQATGIPLAVSSRLKKMSIVFLGYPLDAWHYRLVMHIFQNILEPVPVPDEQAVGVAERNHEERDHETLPDEELRLAVRKYNSAMEKLTWDRLDVDVVPMDPNEFAQKILDSHETN